MKMVDKTMAFTNSSAKHKKNYFNFPCPKIEIPPLTFLMFHRLKLFVNKSLRPNCSKQFSFLIGKKTYRL